MPVAPEEGPTTGSNRGGSGWVAPLLVLMVGSFLPPMDSGIVNVAIPHIQKALGGGADDVAWVSTAYSLGLGLFVPLSNWMSLRLGLTLLHRVALLGFLAGSTLCGLAWDLNSLIGFRLLAALPGSIVPVVTISIIFQITPKERIGTAMGLYGLGVAVAPSMGPALGGLIVQDASWRWIFHFKTPIGIAAVIAGAFLLPKLERARSVPRFDWLGLLTFGYGLSALIVVTAKGQKWHWNSYLVMILAASAVLSLALFAVIENEVEHPLLDLRALRCWPFVNSLLLIGVLMIGMFAMVYYTPQFLQNGQGLSARTTGLVMLPMGLMMAALVPLAGVAYDKVGARWPTLVGMLGTILGAYLLAHGINVDMTRQEAALWVCVAVLGSGLGLMPIMTNGLNWLPPDLVGHGGALNNVMQRMSSALGVAAMGVLVARSNAQLAADTGAVRGRSSLVGAPTPDRGASGGGSAGAAGSSSGAVSAQASPGPGQEWLSPGGLGGLHLQVVARLQALSYADMFLTVSGMTGLGVVLALLMRRPPRPAPPDPSSDAAAPRRPGRGDQAVLRGSGSDTAAGRPAGSSAAPSEESEPMVSAVAAIK